MQIYCNVNYIIYYAAMLQYHFLLFFEVIEVSESLGKLNICMNLYILIKNYIIKNI